MWKVKTVTSRAIGCRDETNNSSVPVLRQNASQGIKEHRTIGCREKTIKAHQDRTKQMSGQISLSGKVIEWKWWKCRLTHDVGVICDIEFDGDIHIQIWPDERRQVKDVQVKKVMFWNFKFSFKNMPALPSFASGFWKCHLLWRTTNKKA